MFLRVESQKFRGQVLLAAILLLMAGLWLFVFPLLSRNETLQRKMAERERQGIHLSAMYYTELEVKDKHQALNRMVEANPWALWSPWAFQEERREE